MPYQESDPDSRSSPVSSRTSPVLPPIHNEGQQDPHEDRRRMYAFASANLDDYLDGETGHMTADPAGGISRSSGDIRETPRSSEESNMDHIDSPRSSADGNDSPNVQERNESRNSEDQRNDSRNSEDQTNDSRNSDDQRNDSRNSDDQRNDSRNSDDQRNDSRNSGASSGNSSQRLTDAIHIDIEHQDQEENDEDLDLSQCGSCSLSRGSSKISLGSDVSLSTPRDRFLDTTRPDRRSFMSDMSSRKLSTALEGNIPEFLAKSPAISESHSRASASPLKPPSSGKRSPPHGPFPVKHRPHVMDLNYDPVLDADMSRSKHGSPDILVIDSQRSSASDDQNEMNLDENADDFFYDSSEGRYRRRQDSLLRQPTLIRTGEISPETPRFSSEQNPEESHLLVAPEIRIEKCSTGVLSSAGGLSSGQSSPSKEVSISDSEEYDTELEDEFEKTPRPPSHMEDIAAYEARCDALQIPPQQLIVRSLKEGAIVLSHRNLGPTAFKALSNALRKNITVTRLELDRTGLGPEGACHLARMLQDNNLISHVNLSGNEIGETGVVAISEMLCYNKGLVSLNLAGNKAGEVGGEALALAVKMNTRLVDLDASKNDLGEVGAIFLGKSLGANESLVKLNLSWNHLRTKGAVAICKGLQVNSTVVEVDLSWNGLGYEGSLALSNMIKHNTSIRSLDISNNRINWQGALLLTKGLKANTVIEELKMGSNPLTTTGCLDIIQAISDNPDSAITFLSLKNVLIVGEFEMIAMLIRQQRPDFRYEHGGVVNSHDVLGARTDKKIDPMMRVINFMKERELRVTELFRGFDKSVGNKLDVEEFKNRLKKAGIYMARFEVEELIERIVGQATKQAGDDINVGKMMKGVEDQLRKERMEKIHERERKIKIQKYHKKILEGPDLKHLEENMSDIKSQMSGMSGHPTQSGYQSPMVAQSQIGSMKRSPLLNLPKQKGVISMGGSLGAKPKEFGAPEKKKKKKKKKRKK